jgi:hypothetical protein
VPYYFYFQIIVPVPAVNVVTLNPPLMVVVLLVKFGSTVIV